jgi:hypothetical protein
VEGRSALLFTHSCCSTFTARAPSEGLPPQIGDENSQKSTSAGRIDFWFLVNDKQGTKSQPLGRVPKRLTFENSFDLIQIDGGRIVVNLDGKQNQLPVVDGTQSARHPSRPDPLCRCPPLQRAGRVRARAGIPSPFPRRQFRSFFEQDGGVSRDERHSGAWRARTARVG